MTRNVPKQSKVNLKFEMVLIDKSYFEKYNNQYVELLDQNNNIDKQVNRLYLYIHIKYKDNDVYVPLRTALPKNCGKIGFSVPSKDKPDAGLDHRKLLIINDSSYIIPQTELQIPYKQKIRINTKYPVICKEVIKYIDGYIKKFEKNQHNKDRRYKFSTLKNFHEELNLVLVEAWNEYNIISNKLDRIKALLYNHSAFILRFKKKLNKIILF